MSATRAQLLRPFAVQEILPVIQQQQPRLIRMFPRPGGRVKRCPQTIACLERSANAGLELQHRAEPKRPEQRVPRGEAVIERTGRRSQAFADGRNGHSGHAALGDDRQGRSEEILLAVFGMTHVSRIRVLDAGVNIACRRRAFPGLQTTPREAPGAASRRGPNLYCELAAAVSRRADATGSNEKAHASA